MTAPPTAGAGRPTGPVRSTEVELFSLAGHDGHLHEVNRAFADLLGLTPQEIDGRSLLELVHPDDISQVVAGLSALEGGSSEVLLETRFVQRQGAPVHLQWVARPVPDTDLWWAAGRDTTEFHRLLARHQDMRARLELALGAATAAMWELDLPSGRLAWEPQATNVLGVVGEALPEGIDELAALAHADDAADVRTAGKRLRETGTVELELRVEAAAGLRHLSLRGRVIESDRRGRALRAVGLVVDVSGEKAMEEQMLRMVMSDALTGVANRRAFDQALRSEWRRCLRAGEPLSVLMVDIDDFKRFNDAFGHLVGDAALCAVARALAGALHREGDTLARFGGEEFAVVLPDSSAAGALEVAERLVEAVRAVTVRQAPDWPLSVSIGVAGWAPGDPAARPVDVLAKADAALYVAKTAGKDRAYAGA